MAMTARQRRQPDKNGAGKAVTLRDTDCKRYGSATVVEQWICSHHAEMAGR